MSEVTFISFAFPGVPNVKCAFQTRAGGVSQGQYAGGNVSFDVGDDEANVKANRASLQSVLKLNSLAFAKQVHGKEMVFDPKPDNQIEGDGLATTVKGLGLAVMTADCQPILLTDMIGKHVAILHVGWKGNKIKFIQAGVAAFCKQYNLIPSQLCAVRGPSLGPARSQFLNFETDWGRSFETWYDALTETVDLWRMSRDQLMMAGVLSAHIYTLDLCTASLPDMFYSYRNNKVTGRQASVIWLE